MEDVAISGEYEIIVGNATTPTVTLFESDPPSTWITFITGTAGQSVQTSVNCFDNPPLRPYFLFIFLILITKKIIL